MPTPAMHDRFRALKSLAVPAPSCMAGTCIDVVEAAMGLRARD